MSNDSNDIAGVIAPPPLLYAGPLALGLLLHMLRPLSLFRSTAARVVGLNLIVAGLMLGPYAFRTLRNAGTEVDPRRPVTALVTTGPYRFSRNPLYLTLTLLYGGITLLVDTAWPALFLPAVLLGMRRGVIDREERYLARRFGDAYGQYRQRVRRWI